MAGVCCFKVLSTTNKPLRHVCWVVKLRKGCTTQPSPLASCIGLGFTPKGHHPAALGKSTQPRKFTQPSLQCPPPLPLSHLLACQQPAVLLGHVLPAQGQGSILLRHHCCRHCCGLNHGDGLGQAARQQAEVVADLVALKLLSTKVQCAVAVIHTHLKGQREGGGVRGVGVS